MTTREDMLAAQVEALTEELQGIKDMLAVWRRNGMDELVAGHGNQYFGGGIMRMDQHGAQIKSTNSAEPLASIWFVPELATDPSSASLRAFLSGVNDGTVALPRMQADNGAALTNYSYLETAHQPGDRSQVIYQSRYGSTTGTVSLYITANDKWLSLTGVPLKLAGFTADFTTTLLDGMLWYRTDTNKFRARANGVTENLATESWATSSFVGGSPWSAQKVLSAASTNGTVVKAAAGTLGPFTLVNTNAAARYLHLYDSTTVTVGTTVPKLTFAIPPSATGRALSFSSDTGIPFTTGICYGLTTGAPDNDAGAVAANEITGVIAYS